MLPHDGEVRMLTDAMVLDVLLSGRPKPAVVPQVRLLAEQLQYVIRLTRVSLRLAGNLRQGCCTSVKS